MNKPKNMYETYKLFLLLFTIILPTAAGLSLLLSILVFCLASSVWWIGLLFLIFALAVLGVWWLIRGYIKDAMKEEKRQEELRAANEPAEAAPEEETPAEEPVEVAPEEETTDEA